MLALGHRTTKQLFAALKLAAVYSAGVMVLMLALVVAGNSRREVLEKLPFLGIPAAVCLGSTFLLLAVARRAGFTALWLVAFGFWTWAASQDFSTFSGSAEFLLWSLLAAPLYAMCILGFHRPSSTPARWRRWMSIAVWPAWAALFVMAIRYLRLLDEYSPRNGQYHGFGYGPYLGALWRLILLACVVAPSVVTVVGILRVYQGTRDAIPPGA